MESKGISFTFATQHDEPDIRRLLRENTMEGSLHISLEREPSAFAADFGIASAQDFVIARDLKTNEVIGLCERVVHECYLNKTPAALPYIGALRVAARYRNRISIIKGGFAKLKDIASAPGTVPFAFTSISEENTTALRLLCANLPGLPRYEPIGTYSTFLLKACRNEAAADALDVQSMLKAANDWNRQHQFAKVWRQADMNLLAGVGLPQGSCFGIQRSGKLCGSIGLWDQRQHRQAVVRHYPKPVQLLRPILNAFATLSGRPSLPKPGQSFNVAVASHFSWLDGREDTFVSLIRTALARARETGIAAVALGFANGGRCHSILLNRFPKAMEFRTRFFKVFWSEDLAKQPHLDGSPLHPELGLL